MQFSPLPCHFILLSPFLNMFSLFHFSLNVRDQILQQYQWNPRTANLLTYTHTHSLSLSLTLSLSCSFTHTHTHSHTYMRTYTCTCRLRCRDARPRTHKYLRGFLLLCSLGFLSGCFMRFSNHAFSFPM
jgi:hypothetical protein